MPYPGSRTYYPDYGKIKQKCVFGRPKEGVYPLEFYDRGPKLRTAAQRNNEHVDQMLKESKTRDANSRLKKELDRI